jgi:outer membrane cobalamin receptor
MLLSLMRKSLIIWCIVPFCLLPCIGKAEENDPQETAQAATREDDTITLGEIKVVASPIIEGNQVDRYGSEITVVTDKQIDSLNAQDLPSALRRAPGVVISRHNPVGSFGGGEGGAIFLRGKGSSRPGAEILMSVDGIPKFVSVWAHPLMDVLSVDPVERIDIYKGAQPVLFGNNAFGVVNLITKRKHEEGFTTRFEGAYGSYNTWVEIAEHGGKKGPFDYYALQSYRRSQGHRDHADGELQEYFGRVGYEFSDHWDSSFVFNTTHDWADDPGSDDGITPPNGTFKVHDYFGIMTLSHSYTWGDGYIKLYWDRGDIDWVDQYNPPPEGTGLNDSDTLTDYDNYGFRVREALHLWEGGEIMVGVDLDYISGEVKVVDPPAATKKFDRTTFRIVSPYLTLSHQFGSKDSWYATPSAGARFFNHNAFGNEGGYQAGLAGGYKNTEVHASYAHAVNYPGLFVKANSELFMPGDNLWKGLDPEILDHFEVGISHTFKDIVKADVTYFYDKGRDRIVVVLPPPPPPTWENIGDYTIKGVEATVRINPLPELALFAGMTYQEASPLDLPYVPHWSASAGLNYTFLKHFHLALDCLYVAEQFVASRGRQEGTLNTDKVDAYFLLNGKVSYDFYIQPLKLGVEIFVAGENLTNDHYEFKKGYPMPGINGMFGVILTL